jgi:hypothetical protein
MSEETKLTAIFSKEEIEVAKSMRDAIIKEGVSELKSIYMAGEIVMWDELSQQTVSLQKEVEELKNVAEQMVKMLIKTKTHVSLTMKTSIDKEIEVYNALITKNKG